MGDQSAAEARGLPDFVDRERDFDRFYRDEFRSVVGLAYSLSGNRWAAEELAQDAFVVAFRQWDRIAGYDRPDAWVRRVVVNRSISRRRRLGTEAKALARVALQRKPAVAELAPEAEAFWKAVRNLPERQAQAVALRYLEDLPLADIAHILDISEGAVKSHLHRGRQTLADQLGEYIEDDPEIGNEEVPSR